MKVALFMPLKAIFYLQSKNRILLKQGLDSLGMEKFTSTVSSLYMVSFSLFKSP